MSIFQNREELLEGSGMGRVHVLDILEAGIESVLPEKVMKEFFLQFSNHLPKRATVIGWGKASLEMFNAFSKNYRGDIIHGHIITQQKEVNIEVEPLVDISFGAHPLPDESSLKSGRKLIETAGKLGKEDTLICLISGGGSSMFEVPHEEIGLEPLREVYELLLRSGADIHETNSVRRALSQNKGGGLAKAAYPARILNIIISDVCGNNVEDIASGATTKDPFTVKPLEVIEKYNLKDRLDSNALHLIKRYSPIPDKYFQNVTTHIIADSTKAVKAMQVKALSLDYDAVRFGDHLKGEARNAARDLMKIPGEIIVGGGETIVNVKGSGKGGRNQEFVLGALKELKGGILACIGTDGIDGSSDAAGAIGDRKILDAALAKGYDINTYLENNDSHSFFRDCGGLIKTGPTGTNVADICVFLRGKESM